MAISSTEKNETVGKRHIYILHPVTRVDLDEEESGETTWVLSSESIHGPIVNAFLWETRKEALSASGVALSEWAEAFGQKSELRVRGMNGKIGETRTYPRSSDPKKSRG